MNDTLTVNVTQEDIDAGEKKSPMCCPISRAINREYEFSFTSTGISTTTVGEGEPRDDDDLTTYRLPLEAQEFIRHFDAGQLVEPFTFTAPKWVDES